ncbi:ester cyclase [Aeromonas sp. S12(2024)]|uniref:ester cyclase n=1 Tax=Aeromonas sp. S12(2024) TaxID=3242885 RepID=UPI003528BB30
MCVHTARELMNKVWNDKAPEFVKDVMTPTTTIESPIKLSVGPDSFCNTLKVWQQAFPTSLYKEDSITTYHNEIVIEWTTKGKHLGEFLSISATGKDLVYQGSSRFTFIHNKISHYSSVVDIQGILGQLMGISLAQYENINLRSPLEDLYDVIPKLLSPFLTRRQIECLSLSTLNLSVKEVATILKIKDSSVQTHLKRAFELLNISNKKMFMTYICDNNTIEVLIRMGIYLKKKSSFNMFFG